MPALSPSFGSMMCTPGEGASGTRGGGGGSTGLVTMRTEGSTRSVNFQVKGGMSCTMATITISPKASTMKRFQVMLTSQAP